MGVGHTTEGRVNIRLMKMLSLSTVSPHYVPLMWMLSLSTVLLSNVNVITVIRFRRSPRSVLKYLVTWIVPILMLSISLCLNLEPKTTLISSDGRFDGWKVWSIHWTSGIYLDNPVGWFQIWQQCATMLNLLHLALMLRLDDDDDTFFLQTDNSIS